MLNVERNFGLGRLRFLVWHCALPSRCDLPHNDDDHYKGECCGDYPRYKLERHWFAAHDVNRHAFRIEQVPNLCAVHRSMCGALYDLARQFDA